MRADEGGRGRGRRQAAARTPGLDGRRLAQLLGAAALAFLDGSTEAGSHRVVDTVAGELGEAVGAAQDQPLELVDEGRRDVLRLHGAVEVLQRLEVGHAYAHELAGHVRLEAQRHRDIRAHDDGEVPLRAEGVLDVGVETAALQPAHAFVARRPRVDLQGVALLADAVERSEKTARAGSSNTNR